MQIRSSGADHCYMKDLPATPKAQQKYKTSSLQGTSQDMPPVKLVLRFLNNTKLLLVVSVRIMNVDLAQS